MSRRGRSDPPSVGSVAAPSPINAAPRGVVGDDGDPRADARRAGMLVWGQIAAKATVAVAPLLIVRLLGQAEVGAFATLLLVYETVAVVLTAGFPPSILYFFAGRPRADRRVIALRMVVLLAALGVVGAVGIRLLAVIAVGDGRWGLTGIDPTHLSILGLYAIFDLPARLGPNLLLGEGKARGAAAAELAKALGAVVATLVPLVLGLGVLGVVVAFGLFGVVQGVALAVALVALYRRTGPAEDPPSTRTLVSYALPLGVTDVVNELNRRVDLWLIVLLFGVVDVAVYQAGAWQIPVITTVAYSVGSVYLARYATLHQAGRYGEALVLWRDTIAKVSLIVVPAAAVFFVAAEELVAIAFTDEYRGAAPVFRLYTLLTMIRVTAFGQFMVSAGRPGFVLRSAVVTLVSNVLISVPFTLWLGITGAAVGTVVAFVPTMAVYCAYIARAWHVGLADTFPLVAYGRVVAVALPPIGVGFAAKNLVELGPGAELGLVAVVVIGAFAGLGTAVGLIDRADWCFVADWLRFRS